MIFKRESSERFEFDAGEVRVDCKCDYTQWSFEVWKFRAKVNVKVVFLCLYIIIRLFCEKNAHGNNF